MKKKLHGLKILNGNEFKAQDRCNAREADSLCSYVLLFYLSMQCLFKLHSTLRGLGDNSCHLVESPL